MSDCIDWEGRISSAGYAMEGRTSRVSRRVLAEKLGRALLPGEVARHTCDRPVCVNPEHLIPGTQSDNVNDAVARGRKFVLREGDSCAQGHELTEDNIIRRADYPGRIRCRECANEYSRAYYARKTGKAA